ncbi:MAG: hypothetical protein V1711_01850 [bacterium]
MKKIDRLRWIEETFGKEFVLPYVLCNDLQDILNAINAFEATGKTWGFRTDTREGQTQGILCPFLFKGTINGARKIWNENKKKLYYLVCENILEVRCHGVAVLLDAEHIFIEFNDKEPFISLRDMYKHPKNLRHIGIGPSSFVFVWEIPTPIRCFHPEETSMYSFDRLYRLMVSIKLREIVVEFTVTDKKKIIIW